MRIVDMLADSKTLGSGVTKSWSKSEIPGEGVVAYLFELGANVQLSNISKIVVKADNEPIISLPLAHYQAYIQRVSRGNYSPAAADTVFVLPFYTPDEKGERRDLCQFPVGKAPTIEVTMGTYTPGADDTLRVGWIQKLGLKPQWSRRFLTEPTGVGASATDGRYKIDVPENCLVRGFTMPLTNLTSMRLFLSGVKVRDYRKALLQAEQKLEEVQTLTSTIYRKLDVPMPAPKAGSYFQLTTGASWSATVEEIGLDCIVPQVA